MSGLDTKALKDVFVICRS